MFELLAFPAILWIALYAHIVAHEGAHYGVARGLGMATILVEVGEGPALVDIVCRGEHFILRLIPTKGFHRIGWRSRRRWRNVAVGAAGPCADLVMITAAIVINAPSYVLFFYTVSLIQNVCWLDPKSDGGQIAALFRPTRPS